MPSMTSNRLLLVGRSLSGVNTVQPSRFLPLNKGVAAAAVRLVDGTVYRMTGMPADLFHTVNAFASLSYERAEAGGRPEPVKGFETFFHGLFCVSLVMAGLLIQAVVGSLGGVGWRWRNRAGLAL